jgi:hypothetical protein
VGQPRTAGGAGVVAALAGASRRRDFVAGVIGALERTAVREGGHANWPPALQEGLVHRTGTIRTHGPLRKGAGLRHGTAGNGFAFLKLFARTGDERWLERARRSASRTTCSSAWPPPPSCRCSTSAAERDGHDADVAAGGHARR